MQPKIAIISFSNLKSDSRVRRQINYFNKHYTVVTIGLKDPEIENVEFHDISYKLSKIYLVFIYFLLIIGFYEKGYWKHQQLLTATKKLPANYFNSFDVIISNDIDSVPLAIKLAGKQTKLVFDAHEYSPLEHDDSFIWRLVFKKYKTYLIKKYAPLCDLMLTVCNGIAEEYKKVFNLIPIVISNASNYFDIHASKTGDKIKLIHHGLTLPTRKIENMIEMMKYVDNRYELYLMLVNTNKTYYKKLQELASNQNNVHFIESVQTDEIVPFTAKFDIGLYILEPTNFNNANALPNKFFEFIQSRLAIAIGPSPEMASILKKEKNGVVANDFNPNTLAKQLNKLTVSDIDKMKENSNNLAQTLNAKVNMQLLHQEIEKLLVVK